METMTKARAERAGGATQDRVLIRPVDTVAEYRQCEDLQAEVWGSDDIVGIPLLGLMTAQENGGLVLGAFTPSGRLAGFVYSFPGLTSAGKLKQCSVILGVDPSYQHLGLGFRLKMAQREEALRLGIDLITWTFDPLRSVNAYLNFTKLGTVASAYLPNVYGLGRGLNDGLETDRLLVEWWLTDKEGEDADALERPDASVATVNTVEWHPRHDVPVNRRYELGRTEETLLVHIPRDMESVKEADLDLARAWRSEIREMLCGYLGRGYLVRGFRYDKHDADCSPCYVLRRPAGP